MARNYCDSRRDDSAKARAREERIQAHSARIATGIEALGLAGEDKDLSTRATPAGAVRHARMQGLVSWCARRQPEGWFAREGEEVTCARCRAALPTTRAEV